MQLITDFLPVIIFFATYRLSGDLFTATGALIAAVIVQTAVTWVRFRKLSPMALGSAALVIVFGGLTLILKNETFIQWKPTVFFWAVGVAFLASQWIGAKPLAQRLMASAVGDSIGRIERSDWSKLNLAWVAFYLLMGAANLAVVFNYSQDTWVNFKVYGITGVTLVFVVAQTLWLSRRAGSAEPAP